MGKKPGIVLGKMGEHGTILRDVHDFSMFFMGGPEIMMEIMENLGKHVDKMMISAKTNVGFLWEIQRTSGSNPEEHVDLKTIAAR